MQFFANRSDAAGGSTLGNIAMSQVSMNAAEQFYSSHINMLGDGKFLIEFKRG